MMYISTITSKRQVTIPAKLFRKLNLTTGSSLIFQDDGVDLKIVKAKQLIASLAGSVKVPKNLKNVDLDDAINEAKKIHFSKKYAKK